MDSFCTPVVGRRAARALIDDWDLDLDDLYWRQPYLVSRRRNTLKLVHKILFSMPAPLRYILTNQIRMFTSS